MLLNKHGLTAENCRQATSIIIEDLNLQKKFHTVAVTIKSSSSYPYYKESKVLVAKTTFKPRSFSLAPNKTKTTTFTFSGSQIKQKLDLSQIKPLTKVNLGNTYLDLKLDGRYRYSY